MLSDCRASSESKLPCPACCPTRGGQYIRRRCAVGFSTVKLVVFAFASLHTHMSYIRNTLKGVIEGSIGRVIKGDTRTLDTIAHPDIPCMAKSVTATLAPPAFLVLEEHGGGKYGEDYGGSSGSHSPTSP